MEHKYTQSIHFILCWHAKYEGQIWLLFHGKYNYCLGERIIYDDNILVTAPTAALLQGTFGHIFAFFLWKGVEETLILHNSSRIWSLNAPLVTPLICTPTTRCLVFLLRRIVCGNLVLNTCLTMLLLIPCVEFPKQGDNTVYLTN